MFYPCFGPGARLAAVAQVEHEARVARGEAAEAGCGHPGTAQEDFDLADQHGFSSGESLSETVVAREILLV
jgi:hypothetical protein